MTQLTDQESADKGMERVPWSKLEDVKWNAIYTWSKTGIWLTIGRGWKGIDADYIVFVDHKSSTCVDDLVNMKYSEDNGRTWHGCYNVKPIGGNRHATNDRGGAERSRATDQARKVSGETNKDIE